MVFTQEILDETKLIIDESIRLNETDFEIYLKMKINSFLSTLDMNKLDDRSIAKNFLSYLNTLYLNICLNGQDKYLLGETEEKLALKGRKIINDIITELRSQKIQ